MNLCTASFASCNKVNANFARKSLLLQKMDCFYMIQLPNLQRVWSGLFEGRGKLARILHAYINESWKPTPKDTSPEYPISQPSSGFWLAVTPARDPLHLDGKFLGRHHLGSIHGGRI
jgi:hypothetical protein